MSFVAWPLAFLLFALVFIFAFKHPIERLLDRTRKIGKSGIETTPAAPTAVAQETGIELAKKSGAEELMAAFENGLLIEQEGNIRRELDIRRVDSPGERERVLVRHLAASQIYGRFERTYNLIFGSQLSLLQALNSNPLAREGTQGYYLVASMLTPEFYANYSFEQWLNFLISQGLVRLDNETLSITVAGREFLAFLIQEGRTFQKQG